MEDEDFSCATEYLQDKFDLEVSHLYKRVKVVRRRQSKWLSHYRANTKMSNILLFRSNNSRQTQLLLVE